MEFLAATVERGLAADDQIDDPTHHQKVAHQQQEVENSLMLRQLADVEIRREFGRRHGHEKTAHDPDETPAAGPADQHDRQGISDPHGIMLKDHQPQPAHQQRQGRAE